MTPRARAGEMTAEMLLVRITALLAGALAIGYLWRRSPRRVHEMWTVVFAAVIALPVIADLMPALPVPVQAAWMRGKPDAPPPVSLDPGPVASAAMTDATPIARGPNPTARRPDLQVRQHPGNMDGAGASMRWTDLRTAFLVVWAIGSTVALGLIALSIWRARRLVRDAVDLGDPLWARDAAAIGRALGSTRDVRLLVSPRVATPMAGQVWRPAIFLPEDAASWSAETRRAVLGHEMAHLVRHDPMRHLLTRVMLATYWFHPLAWMAASLDTQACEDACDDTVIRELGMRPSTYANVLLDCVPAVRRLRAAAIALPMARRGTLERRLLRILRQSPATRPGLLPAPALVCAVLAAIAGAAEPMARVRPVPPPSERAVLHTSNPPASERVAPAAVRPSVTTSGRVPSRPQDIGCRPEQADPGVIEMLDAPRPPGTNLVISEAVVATGYTRRMAREFGSLNLCLLVEEVRAPEVQSPGVMIADAARAVLEARYGASRQRLEIARTPDGSVPRGFVVNGAARPIDHVVLQWQQRLVSVFDLTWQLTQQPRDVRIEAQRQAELSQLLDVVQAMAARPAEAAAVWRAESACDLASPPLIPRGSGPGLRPPHPRFLRETLGNLSVCVRIDEGNVFESVRPSELMHRAAYVVLEARRDGALHQLAMARDSSGATRASWRVNGVDRPIDAAALVWRQSLVNVLDTSWQIWALQGKEGLLNGEIAEVQGRVATDDIGPRAAEASISALRAEIDALDVETRIADWTRERERQVEQFRTAMSAVQ